MASYKDKSSGVTQLGRENKGFFSKILRNVSNWGMDTEDMVRNSHAIGNNQMPTPNDGSVDNLYDVVSQNAVAKMMQKKNIAYLDRSYPEKMRILQEYSRKDEIRDFVTKVADEAIMYDEQDDFCYPNNLPDEFEEDLKKKYLENFKKIYQKFNFNDGTVAWNYFRSLLVNGYLAFEIIYDEKHKEVIGFNQLDPSTLLAGIEPTTGDSIWIQFPEAPEFRRILLDSQIIYISYSSGAEFSEVSYVENLIRPYNQLKLLEQTRIMFNLVNAMSHKTFVVPVAGMSRQMAEQQLSQLIADYKDEITFDDNFGTVQVNGSPHIPYNKEYWFPEGESGTPTVEVLNQEGHDLNENDMLTWFYNALKRASKIPFTRFDKTNGGGNVFGDSSEMNRDELDFFTFIQRLRTIFKEIIVKPWKIKMILDYPELYEDENFLSIIDVEFNGANLFHEWKKLANMSKRADMVGSMLSSILDSNGEPYFSVEWLVRDIMKMDDETLKENERWKKKGGVGTGEGDGSSSEGGGGDFGGGTDDFGGGTDDFGSDDLGGGTDDLGGDDGGSDIVDDAGGGEELDF